ncbi:MAG: 3-isopropylmalate dehydrogenase [Dehalococcoidia bacterium]
MEFEIAVLSGDGIGPEVTQESVKILKVIEVQFGHKFNLTYGDIGGISIDKNGTALTEEVEEIISNSDAVLFGAVGGPKWDDPTANIRPEDGLLKMRANLGAFANIRPVKVYPDLVNTSVLKPEVLDNVDIVVVRELTGGLYYGQPKGRGTQDGFETATDTLFYTAPEIERVLRVGFELAKGRSKKLASIDKANVLETSRLWRQIATELSSEYPDVELEHVLVDACAMQLVQNPSRFDVIVAENTFGDILTDEAAILTASMGLLPSASLSGVPQIGKKTTGLYEPIHGTAPDIAGQGIANPTGSILSTALMLRYSLGLNEEAITIEKAVEQAISDGFRTAELNGPDIKLLSTSEFADQIIKNV